MNCNPSQFRKKVYTYYKKHGRHDLPWRQTRNPYHILVSEVMLQQTQVGRVIPKYNAFIAQFPTVHALARASLVDILRLWSGLGYNRRARMLQRAATIVCEEYKGIFPTTQKLLEQLPGIGPYTAGAVMVFAYGKPVVIIETNIRSVYIDTFFNKATTCRVHDDELLPLILKTMDRNNPSRWYAALMDYGTHIKQERKYINRQSMHHIKQKPFSGSQREVRGYVLKLLIDGAHSEVYVLRHSHFAKEKVMDALEALAQDGILEKKRYTWSVVT